MVKKNVAQRNSIEMGTTTETITLSTVSSEGELSCVLIYPSQKHVSNYTFAPIFDLIKGTLIDEGFKLRLLSDETKDSTRYINEFVKIANECVYGVVILDGLRPNVLLELGILIGLNKPFTLLKSKDAEISVKTLYVNSKEANLTKLQFDNLHNPKIKIGGVNHLSDFSTHLTIFDPSDNKGGANHVSTKLKESIKRMKDSINEEYTKITTKQLSSIGHANLGKYHTILFDILRYYFKDEQFNLNGIRSSHEMLRKFESRTGIKSPASIRSIIGSLYTSLATKAEWKNVEEVKEYFREALIVYNYALKYEPHDFQKAEIRMKIGNTYWELSQYVDPRENSKEAVKAYEKALKVYTLDRFPMQYAMTQNNLGNAYGTLAEVEVKAENCKKAVKAYEKALKVRTLDRFPMQYAMTQNNLGTAYRTLAEVEAKAENCKKAVRAYEKSLKVRTLGRFPMDYAMTQNNLGNAYGTLAEVEVKAENCKKAIKAYEKALKVYTLDRFPMDYAMTQNNLGNAYRTIAEVEAKAENCKKAIKAYEKSLKVRTLSRFPMQYARTQNNLGNAYVTLAEVEAKAENCKKAIKAYEKPLKVYPLDRFPMDYAMTQNNLGNAYGTLAEVESKAENCKKAIKAYEKSLKVYTMEDFPESYKIVKHNLRKGLDFCGGKI